MFHKDTFRLIAKTRKRFITIVLIVLIGVAFMVGLMSSAPTMRYSVDKYFDDTNFMDIQLFSSYGFDDRDVNALKKAPQVASVYPTRFVDVFIKRGDSALVTRIQESDSWINQIELVSGRMPQKPGEALALGSASFASAFAEGSTIHAYLEEGDLSESLSVTDFEIVGVARSPQYMAASRETSTLNNLTLDTVIFVPRGTLTADYYTSVYLTLNGAKDYMVFNEDYSTFVEETMDEVYSDVIKDQQKVRRDEVMAEVAQQIADGEKELEEELAKSQKEIDDGKKKLEDAYIQILIGEAQIEANLTQITTGEKELAAAQQLIADGEKQLADGKKQIEQRTGMSYSEAINMVKTMYSVYNLVNGIVIQGGFEQGSTIDQIIGEKQQLIADKTRDNVALAGELLVLNDENTTLKLENAALETENNNLISENATLEQENTQLETEGNLEQIAANKLKIAANLTTIEANNLKIGTNNIKVTANETKISSINKQMEENNTAIADAAKFMADLDTIAKLMGDKVLAEIPGIINDMMGGDIEGIYASVLQMESAEKELAAGRKEVEARIAEMTAGKAMIESAQAELKKGRAEYEKGLKDLEAGQKKLDEESEKARIELEKAKQQLAELPKAEWMILDHSMHYSTYMFENNAAQMWKIGLVFPMLFFLVAALVCMTTMKRLVDEQRSQIGVFSALGFSNSKITSKYVIYALAASLMGSVVAIPIGMAMFPTVIYFCWRLMYDLPDMVLTMPPYIAVLGVLSFTVLMMIVTFVVVRGILKENPSRLMRPKAPRNAKKVFLEKIPFIWKRMSFTSKVTARNIIRYKSRFFMTVIGVAGCTSLLVLGFAIKGSISQVVSIQYGDIVTYNTTVALEDTDRLEEVHNLLLADDNIEYAVPMKSYTSMTYTEEKDNTINVYIMAENDVSQAFDLRQRRDGQPLSVKKGVVVSEKFSKLCGVSVGDEITIESLHGIKKQVKVTGICEMYTQHYLFISEDMYEDIFGETVVYDTIAVTAADSTAVAAKYEKTQGVGNISDFSGMISTFDNMFGSLDIIIVVIILVAGSLSLVVIMNLTEVNISERIREIATLKVLGFNNQEVYSYVFKEVFILSLIGMIVGLPFGKLELVFVMDIIDMEMVMFPTIVQPSSYLFAAVITMVFTALVIMLMRKTLRNVEMVESLKSVE